MNGRVKSEGSGSSIGEDDDIATVEETFDETSSGLANTSPTSNRGSSPLHHVASSKSESSPTSAAVASVQAALAALQAGQMSLNQVKWIIKVIKVEVINQSFLFIKASGFGSHPECFVAKSIKQCRFNVWNHKHHHKYDDNSFYTSTSTYEWAT